MKLGGTAAIPRPSISRMIPMHPFARDVDRLRRAAGGSVADGERAYSSRNLMITSSRTIHFTSDR